MHAPQNRHTARIVAMALAALGTLVGFKAVSAQPAQFIRGQVFDVDTQATLAGANVVLKGSDPLVGTMTDADGFFELGPVAFGRHDLVVSFIGYEVTAVPQLLVTSGRDLDIRVELRPRILEGEEVVVEGGVPKDRVLNDLALVSARSFSTEETRRYAGGFDDPARMASAFAGITTSGGIQENAMIIRGNSPKGVLWRLEGVEIPNPNHFAGLNVAGGGGITLFSTAVVASSDFLTGAFPAEYGNALSGVFDMNFRNGNRSARQHAVQLGLLGLDVASEGPFAKESASTYLFNYRYSTLGLLLPILPTEDVAVYQDLSFNLSFPTRKFGRYNVWGIGGLDGQTTSAETDSAKWEYDSWDRLDSELDMQTGAAGVSHDLVLGKSSYLHTSLAATYAGLKLDQRRIGDDLILNDDLLIDAGNGRIIIGSYLNTRLRPRHTNRTGLTAQQLFYDLSLSAASDSATIMTPIVGSSGSSTLFQAFSQSRLDVSRRLTVNIGAHLQRFALTGQTVVEPRGGLQFEYRPGSAISLGYGLHSQIEDLRFYFVDGSAGNPFSNESLGFSRAHHVVAAHDTRLSDNARLKVEAYYQWLFDIPVIADSSFSLINFEQDFTFNEALVNDGEGRNVGVELTLERFLDNGFYYLFTGSLFQARYRGGDDVWRDTRFARGYTVNGLFGKEITVRGDDLLGLNVRLNFMGGNRRSPIDIAKSLEAEEVIFDERAAFTVSEPDMFVLDVTVTFQRNHRRYAGIWALQVKNALGAEDVSFDYNLGTKTIDEVNDGTILPVLSYRIEF